MPALEVFEFYYFCYVRKLQLIIVVLLLSQSLWAQDSRSFLTVGVSSNAYMGDLSPSPKKWTSSFHLGLKFHKARLLNGQFNLSFGTITGQNRHHEAVSEGEANDFFQTRVITANYDLQINLLKANHYAIYVSQGIGFTHYNPQNEYYEPLQEIPSTRAVNETYGNTAIILPTQIGAYYIFKNGYGIGLQSGIMNTMTDYLDNISQLGSNEGNDNILMNKVSFMVPLN